MANGTGNSKELPPGAWPVVACRMHPDQRRTITMAAALLDVNRSDFMRDTLLLEARRILDEAA